jgi:hypothetical protein
VRYQFVLLTMTGAFCCSAEPSTSTTLADSGRTLAVRTRALVNHQRPPPTVGYARKWGSIVIWTAADPSSTVRNCLAGL